MNERITHVRVLTDGSESNRPQLTVQRGETFEYYPLLGEAAQIVLNSKREEEVTDADLFFILDRLDIEPNEVQGATPAMVAEFVAWLRKDTERRRNR